MIIQNNCLYELKERVRECVSLSNLEINCDEILNCVREEIDFEKFKAWLEYNKDKIKSKTNQTSYFKKSFMNELEKGTFKLENQIEYVPNTQPLMNALRERGICVMCAENMYMSVLFDYLINKLKIDLNTIKTLNHQILDYMNDTQEFSDYLALIKKSKTLKKYKIDWDFIDQQTKKQLDEWDSLMEEIDKIESEIKDND